MRACKYETKYRQDYHCAWCARAFTINIPICRKEELRRGEHLPSVRPSEERLLVMHACANCYIVQGMNYYYRIWMTLGTFFTIPCP